MLDDKRLSATSAIVFVIVPNDVIQITRCDQIALSILELDQLMTILRTVQIDLIFIDIIYI